MYDEVYYWPKSMHESHTNREATVTINVRCLTSIVKEVISDNLVCQFSTLTQALNPSVVYQIVAHIITHHLHLARWLARPLNTCKKSSSKGRLSISTFIGLRPGRGGMTPSSSSPFATWYKSSLPSLEKQQGRWVIKAQWLNKIPLGDQIVL